VTILLQFYKKWN